MNSTYAIRWTRNENEASMSRLSRTGFAACPLSTGGVLGLSNTLLIIASDMPEKAGDKTTTICPYADDRSELGTMRKLRAMAMSATASTLNNPYSKTRSCNRMDHRMKTMLNDRAYTMP